MRIAIYGAGSMGTVLGAYISRKGEYIELINHNQAHVLALQLHGAHVTGTVDFVQPVIACLPEEMSGCYDVIILLTKQLDNPAVVRFLKPFLSDDGVLVTMQNGIPEAEIAEILGPDKVLGCIVAWGATLKGPGVSELTSSPDSLTFMLGAPNPQAVIHLNKVKSVLELMGPVTLEGNFIGARWSKLLINSSFSGMSTVLGCTFGQTVAKWKSRKIVLELIQESINVCKTAGITIEPVQGKNAVKLLGYNGPVKKFLSMLILPIAIRKHAHIKASMLQDIERGKKKTEANAINGAVVAFGKKVGCPTPMNEKVAEIIHRIEKGELTPSFQNLSLFD